MDVRGISGLQGQPGDDDVASHLLQRIARGDRAAMESFFRLYQATVYRFALTRLGDPAQAADVLHAVMLKVWRNAHRYQRRRSTIRERLLRVALEATYEFDPTPACQTVPGEVPEAPPSHRLNPVDALKDAARVQGELRRLSTTQRTILHLHFDEGLSVSAIAHLLGSATALVERQVAHARHELLQRLAA